MSRLQMFLTVAYFVLVLVGCQIKNRSAVTGMFSDVSVSRIVTTQASGATHLFMRFQWLVRADCTSNQPVSAAKVRRT